MALAQSKQGQQRMALAAVLRLVPSTQHASTAQRVQLVSVQVARG
jgi:hypothetical protein